MQGIKINNAQGTKSLYKVSNNNINNISFTANDTSDNKLSNKTKTAMGAGLVALGILNIALVVKMIKGKDSDSVKTLESMKKAMGELADDVSKLREQTSTKGFDKTQATSKVSALQDTIKTLADKIKTLSQNDKTGKYTQLGADLDEISLNLDKVTQQLTSTSDKDAAALTNVITALQDNSDKLSQQVTAPVPAPAAKVKPEMISAIGADSNPVTGVEFSKGIAQNADGSAFNGTITYKTKDGTLSLTTDEAGKIVRSLKEDTSGNVVFDKTMAKKAPETVVAPVVQQPVEPVAEIKTPVDNGPVFKKSIFLGAKSADSTPVEAIDFSHGTVKYLDGKPFEGMIRYQMPDSGIVTITTDDKGLVTGSVKKNSKGETLFDKEYIRKTKGETDVKTIKTLTADGKKHILVETSKSQDGVQQSLMVTRAIQEGNNKVQLTSLTKQDGRTRLLDGSKVDSSRTVEIISTPDGTVQQTVITKNRPLGYVYKGNRNGVDNYFLADFEPVVFNPVK